MTCCMPNNYSEFGFIQTLQDGGLPGDDCHDLDKRLASGRQRLDRGSQLAQREAADQKGEERLHHGHKMREGRRG